MSRLLPYALPMTLRAGPLKANHAVTPPLLSPPSARDFVPFFSQVSDWGLEFATFSLLQLTLRAKSLARISKGPNVNQSYNFRPLFDDRGGEG